MPPSLTSMLRNGVAAVFFLSVSAYVAVPASAETIGGALAKAYSYNSELNSARAGVRVTDETVAIAKSAWRPTIAGTSSLDYTSQQRRPPNHRFVWRANPANAVRRLSDHEQRAHRRGARESLHREPA